jgi:hypothetical protein
MTQTRRGFLGGLIAVAFTPVLAKAAEPAQYTLGMDVASGTDMTAVVKVGRGMTTSIFHTDERPFVNSPDFARFRQQSMNTDWYCQEYSIPLNLPADWVTNPDINKDGSPKKGIVIEVSAEGEFLSVTRAP